MICRQHGYEEHAGKVSGQNSKSTCRIGVAAPLGPVAVPSGTTHFPLVIDLTEIVLTPSIFNIFTNPRTITREHGYEDTNC